MNEATCPACSGPDNAECATCNGTSLVTQEVHDAIVAEQEVALATWKLQKALRFLPVENVPGVEQTSIVVTTIDNQIKAEVDAVELVWDEENLSWSE